MNGRSATSIRRSRPGRRCASTRTTAAQNGGGGDVDFLERVFQKLLLNFTWWVNRKDAQGRNIFEGGFLGLDNIGVFDRSAPLPTGGYIEQSDGTAWMAMYCLNMLHIAARARPARSGLRGHGDEVLRAFSLHRRRDDRAAARASASGTTTDNFYYDQLCLPDGRDLPMRIRSMVGLIPLFAVGVSSGTLIEKLPELSARIELFPRAAQPIWRSSSRAGTIPAPKGGACCRWRACSA